MEWTVSARNGKYFHLFAGFAERTLVLCTLRKNAESDLKRLPYSLLPPKKIIIIKLSGNSGLLLQEEVETNR